MRTLRSTLTLTLCAGLLASCGSNAEEAPDTTTAAPVASPTQPAQPRISADVNTTAPPSPTVPRPAPDPADANSKGAAPQSSNTGVPKSTVLPGLPDKQAKVIGDIDKELTYNGMTLRLSEPAFHPAEPGRMPHITAIVTVTTKADERRITDQAFWLRMADGTIMENATTKPQEHVVTADHALTLQVQFVALEPGRYSFVIDERTLPNPPQPRGWIVDVV